MTALAYDRSGSGEPQVLVHGLGSRRGAWGPVVEMVAAEREVINIDLPGFGDSPALGEIRSVQGFVDCLQGFFVEIGVERPHYAGNSLGGGIGLELGHRGAIRSLTAFSPIGFYRRPGEAWCRGALRVGFELGQRRGPPSGRVGMAIARLSLFLHAFGHPFRVPAGEILATAESGVNAPGFIDALAALEYRVADPAGLDRLPVTIAWGRRDVLLSYAIQSRRARRKLPHARHVTLPGCGHVPFFDDPELCARVLLEGTAG